MLVNTIARGKLTSKKGVKPSEREIELNIKLARDAVELVKSSGGEETKQTSEHFNMFKMAGRNTKDESVEEDGGDIFRCNTTNTSSMPCHNRILNIAEGNEGEVLHRSQRMRKLPAKFADAYDDKEVSSKRGPVRPMKNGKEEKDYSPKPQTKRHIPAEARNVERSEAVGVCQRTGGKWVRVVVFMAIHCI